MEEARLLSLVPEPVPHGCVGACLGCSEADEWRAADPTRYCAWVAEVAAEEQATVAGAWFVWSGSTNVLWSTGLDFERIMARLRLAGALLRSEGLTADEALAARTHLARAADVAATWDTDPEVFEHVPELSADALARLSTVAWAVAHALTIRELADISVQAGLWRSLARALQHKEQSETGSRADLVLRAASVYAECEALRASGLYHFEQCRAGAARACLARALERARAVHVETQRVVSSRRVDELQRDFDRIHSVAARVDGGMGTGRVFDSTLMCPLVELPEV